MGVSFLLFVLSQKHTFSLMIKVVGNCSAGSNFVHLSSTKVIPPVQCPGRQGQGIQHIFTGC